MQLEYVEYSDNQICIKLPKQLRQKNGIRFFQGKLIRGRPESQVNLAIDIDLNEQQVETHRQILLMHPVGGSWMGFAIRWGGTRMVVACLVENGIRILIPVTAYATYHSSKWLGNELAGEAIKLAEGGTATPIQLNQEEVRKMQDDAGNALLEELE